MRARVIGIFGSLIWSKTLMELIFNPGGEFRCSQEGQVSQIHSPHLQVGPWDILRTFKFCSDAKEGVDAEGNGKLPNQFIPSKTASLGSCICGGRPVVGKNCSLGGWICSERPALGQNTLMMMMMMMMKKMKKIMKMMMMIMMMETIFGSGNLIIIHTPLVILVEI